MIVDAWMQHPTLRFAGQDMFASLRRWTGGELPDEEPPIALTVEALRVAGVDFGLLSAPAGSPGDAHRQRRGGRVRHRLNARRVFALAG